MTAYRRMWRHCSRPSRSGTPIFTTRWSASRRPKSSCASWGPSAPVRFRPPEVGHHWRNLNWRERVGGFRVIGNNVFAFPDGHPLLELTVEVATRNIEARLSQDIAEVTGPGIFTNLYLAYELGSLERYSSYVRQLLRALGCGAPPGRRLLRADRACLRRRQRPADERGRALGQAAGAAPGVQELSGPLAEIRFRHLQVAACLRAFLPRRPSSASPRITFTLTGTL